MLRGPRMCRPYISAALCLLQPPRFFWQRFHIHVEANPSSRGQREQRNWNVVRVVQTNSALGSPILEKRDVRHSFYSASSHSGLAESDARVGIHERHDQGSSTCHSTSPSFSTRQSAETSIRWL